MITLSEKEVGLFLVSSLSHSSLNYHLFRGDNLSKNEEARFGNILNTNTSIKVSPLLSRIDTSSIFIRKLNSLGGKKLKW
jgi:hypothetical protein